MTKTFDMQIGEEIKETCWLCNYHKLEILMDPVDVDTFLADSPVLICSACGFIQKRLSVLDDELNEHLEQSYYDDYDNQKLLARSKQRAFVDTSRCVEYIRFISSSLDWNHVHRALDIGGGEGLFSHCLKKMYPHIEVYCLEPDLNVTAIGKKLYPEVNFLEIRLEELSTLLAGAFDLVTYWGGFYRTVYPQQAILTLYEKMTNKGILVLSLPSTLESPELQAYEPMDSIDELLGCFKKGFFLFLNDLYMRTFLSPCFKIISNFKKQNEPFLKTIPFYIAQKLEIKQESDTIPAHLDLYRANREYVWSYATQESKKRLFALCQQNSIKKIVIVGVGSEARLLATIAKEVGVQVLFLIDLYSVKLGIYDVSGLSVKPFSFVFTEKPELLIIADIENQEAIYDQMINRLHLDKMIKIIKGFKVKQYPNKQVCFSVGAKTYLRKAFSFELKEGN